MNSLNQSFKRTLKRMRVGTSQLFYHMSGDEKGVAIKFGMNSVRWVPLDRPKAKDVEIQMTIEQCVERFGYE